MWKRVCLAFAACVVLAGCSQGSSANEPAESSAESSANSEPVAVAGVEEEDFDAIYRELEEVSREALIESDIAKLLTVVSDEGPIDTLEERVAKGNTVGVTDDFSYTVNEVVVFQIADEDAVTLRVTDTLVGGSFTIDSDGNEGEPSIREDPNLTALVYLERFDDDSWKIWRTTVVLDEFPASIDAFAEQKAFEVDGQNISFLTVAVSDSECYVVMAEAEPATPSCARNEKIEEQPNAYLHLGLDDSYEAMVVATRDNGTVYDFFVNGEAVEFVGEGTSYAVTVSEYGSVQEAIVKIDGQDATLPMGVKRADAESSELRRG